MNPANQTETEILRRLNQSQISYDFVIEESIKTEKNKLTQKDKNQIYLVILIDLSKELKTDSTWEKTSALIKNIAKVYNTSSTRILDKLLDSSILEPWQKRVVREYFIPKIEN